MVTTSADGWSVPQDTDPLANVADWIGDLAAGLSARACLLSRPAALSVASGAAYVDVPMTAEDSDVHGQSALAAGVYTMTLTEVGLYVVVAQAGWANAAGGTTRAFRILAGATSIAESQGPPSTSSSVNLVGLVAVGLATTIKLQAVQNSGAALNTNGTMRLAAFRIAKAS